MIKNVNFIGSLSLRLDPMFSWKTVVLLRVGGAAMVCFDFAGSLFLESENFISLGPYFRFVFITNRNLKLSNDYYNSIFSILKPNEENHLYYFLIKKR